MPIISAKDNKNYRWKRNTKTKNKKQKKTTTQKQKQTNKKNKSKKTQNDIESNNDIESIKSNPTKNAYPPFLINKVIKKYFNYKFSRNQNQSKDTSHVLYFKLQYISNLSHHIKNTRSKFCNKFCKENVNKDPIPDDLKSFLVYKFTCASCSSNYIRDTYRHLKLRMRNI